MKFTENQTKAIKYRNKNILVSAAAGSGKTAVLVNRIIERVLDDENPIDIDRILVMTFTKAAALQMKERILKAIEEKRALNPTDKNLQKQAALIHSSNIMTIDSFCLNVVRNHFTEINLNPDFRLADTGECNLIMRDVLEKVIEDKYEEGDSSFLNMTETFSTGRTDDKLDDLIIKLHTFSESYPDPEKWLDSCKEAYVTVTCDNFDKITWVTNYTNIIKTRLLEVRRLLEKAGDITCMEYGPLPYGSAIDSDIEYVDGMLKDTYSEMYDFVIKNGEYKPEKLKTYRIPKEGDASFEEIEARNALKNEFTSIRDKTKEIIGKISQVILNNSVEEAVLAMQKMSSPVEELVKLTLSFKEAFGDKKREKNVVDFNDLEHMCLDILRTSESTAKEYRDFFEEIYVDEYQDSNLVQEEILSYLSRGRHDDCNGNVERIENSDKVENVERTENSDKVKNVEKTGNLFMVGDVKQSIYGFRLARPEIFIDKYNRFPSELSDEKSDVKIDLYDNFRSRSTVIDSVNDIFSAVMTKTSGKLIYDENAALHAGASYPEGEGYKTEFVAVAKDDEIDSREMEARATGLKIKDIVGKLSVTGEDGEVRPARYSDVVILLRTLKGWDSVYREKLSEMGIPVHVEMTSGYFSQTEVATLLEYLKIIDNPLQDIPLMASLRSVFGNMNDEEVARIRGAFPDGYLYDALCQYLLVYGDNKDFEVTVSKIRLFLSELTHYREKTSYTSVEDIIAEIIDGKYGLTVLSSKNGKKKFANLNVLLDKAVQYGKTSFKGLFHFNRYIEMLHKYEVDFGEASTLDEKDDAVRIMSIHKSKGLEFPVCIIAGMKKSFNMMDTRDQVILDSDFGVGVNVVDPVKRTKTKTLFRTYLSDKKKGETLEEELRLFYVAMTRAKEKLIMTCVCDMEEVSNGNVMLTDSSSYFDLFRYANCCERIVETRTDAGNFREVKSGINSIDVTSITIEDIVERTVKAFLEGESDKERINRIINGQAKDLPEEISRRFVYEYPYANEKAYEKISVTELKRRSMEMESSEAKDDLINEYRLFEFGSEEEITEDAERTEKKDKVKKADNAPALRGTAIHRVFEIWNYKLDASMEAVTLFIEEIHKSRRIEDDLYPYVDAEIIHDFVNSDIALRMKAAFDKGLLWREQPFVIEDSEQGILIQGIIDAYFIEDDEIVLVDYKTDKVRFGNDLVKKYHVQLDYYATALSRLTGMKVKEKVIYSTTLNECITI